MTKFLKCDAPTSNALRAAEATERPWSVFVHAKSGIGRTNAVYIVDHRGWPGGQIARVNIQDGLYEQEANAALIVTAANDHSTLLSDLASARSRIAELEAENADLLSALKLILPLAKGYAPEGQSLQARRTCDSWLVTATDLIERAALSKGEG